MSNESNIERNELDDNFNEAEEQIEDRSKLIGYFINEYTIGYLADEMNKEDDGDFYIPEYQRNFVWDDYRKSRFIESILLGLPIPFIFYYENIETGRLEIVDGSQRLRTIQAFIHENFKLDNLERLTKLNGFCFSDLTPSRQRKVRNKSIRGIVINHNADQDARQDLFNRINTSSKIASPADIRKGSLSGKFMDLIEDLASKDYFKKLAPRGKREKEREHEELVTRFFAYLHDMDNYKGVVETFLYNFVKKTNEEFDSNPQLSKDYEDEFKRTMDFVEQYFPNGFRKAENAATISRVRFESIAIGVAYAIQQVDGDISKLRCNIIPEWIGCEQYTEILRADGGNVPQKLKKRINFVRDKLIGTEELN